MIWKEKEWVFHYQAMNLKTGEVREFNIGSQVCKMPHGTKRWRQLEDLPDKLREQGSSWSVINYGVQPLETYSYDPV